MTRFRNETSLRNDAEEIEHDENEKLSRSPLKRRASNEMENENSSRQMNKRIRRTLTFLNLNRKQRASGHHLVHACTARRLSLGAAPMCATLGKKSLGLTNSPIVLKPFVIGGVKKKKTTMAATMAIKASTKENLGAIKQQLKKYADEVSSIRVMKRKSTMTTATTSTMSRASKRRDIVKGLGGSGGSGGGARAAVVGMHSFLGWDSNLREYIENPKYISQV